MSGHPRSARRRKASGARAVAARPGPARTLAGVEARRAVIDYSLVRRATLVSLARGATAASEVCDAHPYLLRAARHHGEATARSCPVCRREELRNVTYVYGDELGPYSGRVKSTAELATMAREHGEFRVYVVEVCQACGWNHLKTSYVLGDAARRRAAGAGPRARARRSERGRGRVGVGRGR